MTHSSQRTVTLESVWRWHCPDCGRVNHEQGMELNPEELESARDQLAEMGLMEPEDAATVQLEATPTRVMCAGCSATFNVPREPWLT